MNQHLAQKMCDTITQESGHQVIMVDKEGKIFAASDKNRIGSFHHVAKKVMDGLISEGVVTVNEENENVRAGINSPVKYNDETILVLGMSGDPDVVRPLIGITKQNIIMHIQSEEKIEYLNKKVTLVNEELRQISGVIQQISGVAHEIANESELTVDKAVESVDKLEKTEEILEIIKNIARRSNIIGINAAIEAARVGAAGRGFSVVAKEVQNLAKSSDHSADTIGDTLKEIGNNVGDLLHRVKDNNNVQQEQAKKIQSISHSIIAIEENLEDMVSNMQM